MFMAVAHRSINWPASAHLPSTRVTRYSGSKASISGQASLRDFSGHSGSKRETWRLLYRHEHEPALRGVLI
jgi:hypothetical protein